MNNPDEFDGILDQWRQDAARTAAYMQQLRDSVLAIAPRERALAPAAPARREERVADEDLPFIPDRRGENARAVDARSEFDYGIRCQSARAR